MGSLLSLSVPDTFFLKPASSQYRDNVIWKHIVLDEGQPSGNPSQVPEIEVR